MLHFAFRVHSLGSLRRSTDHPDSRAIFYNEETYRFDNLFRIWDGGSLLIRQSGSLFLFVLCSTHSSFLVLVNVDKHNVCLSCRRYYELCCSL